MRCLLLSLVSGAALSGCAVTSVDGERLGVRSEGFAVYVETVFRQQNAVAADLALALERESADSERYIALDDAELGLLTACRGLNVLAEASRDGNPPRGPGALKRARQAPECERATSVGVRALGQGVGSDPGVRTWGLTPGSDPTPCDPTP